MSHSLIIIRGPDGIGKATISKILAERMDTKYFSIDDLVIDGRLNKIDVKTGRIPVENFLAVQEDIILEIEKQRGKASTIIEGNFYYKEQIEFFKEHWNFNVFVVTLVGKLDICINRDRKKKKSVGKKIITNVHRLVSEFEYGFVVNVEGKAREQIVEQIQKGLLWNRQ